MGFYQSPYTQSSLDGHDNKYGFKLWVPPISAGMFPPHQCISGTEYTTSLCRSSDSISPASISNIICPPQSEPTFQLIPEISRLSSPPLAAFPLTQVAFEDAFVQEQLFFNGGFSQDTSSRHLLRSFDQSSSEVTSDCPSLFHSDGSRIVPSSQHIPGEQSEWTTIPMQYQTYHHDTLSTESSATPVSYGLTTASAAILSELVNDPVHEEESYTGRQTRASISAPDVSNALPSLQMVHLIRPNQPSGTASWSALASVHVQPSLTPAFLTQYHNPTTVLEIQDLDSYSTGLTHSNGLTFNFSSPVSSADRGFDVISLSRDSCQEDLSGPPFADGSRICYQPTLAVVSHTHQPHPPSTSFTPPHSHPVGPSSSKAPNRQQLLERAFRPPSAFPNEARARLLDDINRSSFIRTHEIEPSIDSSEGQALLKNIWDLVGCPSVAFQKSNLSIYSLLLDIESRTCLICKSSKTSLERAIGCVRSHLDHRPFVCGGDSVGCGRCKDYARPRRFFCLPYVVDHLKGQSKKFKCTYLNCEASLRRGGMVRHWNRKHSDSPFPKELFSGYGKRKKENQPPL